jgi:hypothetical protein
MAFTQESIFNFQYIFSPSKTNSMKKTRMFAFLVAAALSQHATAQQDFSSYVKYGLYQFDDTFKMHKSDVFSTYKSGFGFDVNNDMVLQKEEIIDTIGTTGGRYIQYNNGYPVKGTMMNVISKYGIVLYVNGFSLPHLNVNVSSPISEADALDSTLAYFNAPKYSWQDSDYVNNLRIKIDTSTHDSSVVYDTSINLYPKGELVIATPYGDTSVNDTSHYKLCWRFTIQPMYWDTSVIDTSNDPNIHMYDTTIGYRPGTNTVVYINAQTGHVYTVDPNMYGDFYVSCGEHPTWYEGDQNMEGTTCTFCWNYRLADHRGFELWDFHNMAGVVKQHSNTWGRGTGPSAYWDFEKAWDYFWEVHGFYGTGSSSSQVIFNYDDSHSAPVPYRAAFNPNATIANGWDTYQIGPDVSTGAQSAAQLDVIAHEYTHAMIYHGPHLDNYGDAGAVAEGLSDYFAEYAATRYLPSRYLSDWSNGFGWQTSAYARHWSDPTTDWPTPSAGTYHGPHWSYGGDRYINSGVFRRFATVLAPMIPIIEPDFFVTMRWWLWSGVNYPGTVNQFLAEYSYYYGTCSPKWSAVLSAWTSVGLGYHNPCRTTSHIIGNRVAASRDVSGGKVIHRIVLNDPGSVAASKYPINYRWITPTPWNVTQNDAEDLSTSQITLNSTEDYSSQLLSCIVTYADSTTDTLTTFMHFVDDSEAGRQSASPKAISTSDDGLKIYPNPVKTQVTVTLPDQPAYAAPYTLCDITGKEIMNGYLYAKSNLVRLPLLPAGIYIMKINGEKNEYIRRITVQQ